MLGPGVGSISQPSRVPVGYPKQVHGVSSWSRDDISVLELLEGFGWCGYFIDDVRNIRRVKVRTFHDAHSMMRYCSTPDTWVAIQYPG